VPLRAAFSVEELRRELEEAELAELRDAGTRPFHSFQLHWSARGTGAAADGQPRRLQADGPGAVIRQVLV